MGAALALYLYTQFQATLDRFLALPCYDNGRRHVCSVERGSFNRAMIDARDCGGKVDSDDRDGRPFYWAVCPRDVSDDCDTY